MQSDAFRRHALLPKSEPRPWSLPAGRTLEPHYNWTRDDNEEALAQLLNQSDLIMQGHHPELGHGGYLLIFASGDLLDWLAQFSAALAEDEPDSDYEEGADQELDLSDDEPNDDDERDGTQE